MGSGDRSIFKEWYFWLIVAAMLVISLAARLHFI